MKPRICARCEREFYTPEDVQPRNLAAKILREVAAERDKALAAWQQYALAYRAGTLEDIVRERDEARAVAEAAREVAEAACHPDLVVMEYAEDIPEAMNERMRHAADRLSAARDRWRAASSGAVGGSVVPGDRREMGLPYSDDPAKRVTAPDDVGPPAPGEGEGYPNPELEMGPC